MECGCTQLRSGCSGLRLSLSAPGWDWLALCLCRFGRGCRGPAWREAPYRRSNMWESRSFFGWSGERDGNRHHTRAAVNSQPDNAPTQPAIQPTASSRPPTTHPQRTHSFVSIATKGMCASRRLPGDVVSGGVWTSERQSNVRSRCGVALAAVFTF